MEPDRQHHEEADLADTGVDQTGNGTAETAATEIDPLAGTPDAQPSAAEDANAEVSGAAAQPDSGELLRQLEEARARADQLQDQLLRTRAEMENMGRRQAKELENAHKYALDGFVRELLQVRDSLELGVAAAQGPEAEVASLREGSELTLKLLGDVMGKFGVERVDPEGEPFNPDYHQAMSVQPRADVPPNTVVAVIQSGYLLNGRLARPALVMVSKAAD
ncbi:MAG: nucleotide exchange factor GrpE [Chromatiaceae bacterium]|nr:MAG: nucleotide exchange factor GrpE [Chromatiaceae bacterium]